MHQPVPERIAARLEAGEEIPASEVRSLLNLYYFQTGSVGCFHLLYGVVLGLLGRDTLDRLLVRRATHNWGAREGRRWGLLVLNWKKR